MESFELITFSSLCSDITAGITNIDVIFNSKVGVVNSGRFDCWIDSSDLRGLKTSMSRLKVVAQALSDTMTKATLISAKHHDQLPSILKEVYSTANMLILMYFEIAELNPCESLLKSLTFNLKELLAHIKALLLLLDRGDFTSANSATGLVWKTVAAIEKLPVSNKAAHRRNWMEDVSVVSDTLREFSEYVSRARVNQVSPVELSVDSTTGPNEKDDENDENSVDDEDNSGDMDTEYTSEEANTVEQCIGVFRDLELLLKLGLAVMTAACDALDYDRNIPHTALSPDLQSSLSGESGQQKRKPPIERLALAEESAVETSNTESDFGDIRAWLWELVRLRQRLVSSVTDLGCELYPPIQLEGVRSALHETLQHARQMTRLISLHHIVEAFGEESKKAQIRSVVDRIEGISNASLLQPAQTSR